VTDTTDKETNERTDSPSLRWSLTLTVLRWPRYAFPVTSQYWFLVQARPGFIQCPEKGGLKIHEQSSAFGKWRTEYY